VGLPLQAAAGGACSNTVLFMTDGSATLDASQYEQITRTAKDVNAVIFGYALGAGADVQHPQALACRTDGIFYQVNGHILCFLTCIFYLSTLCLLPCSVGLQSSILRRLPCIFYQVANAKDLGNAMSSYYTYFGASQGFQEARWISYTDIVMKRELLAACVPIYDPMEQSDLSVLLAVACMVRTQFISAFLQGTPKKKTLR
jgi:hypothetical protein